MNEIKLIGLSGQLQNGKDTVAQIIQYLVMREHMPHTTWTLEDALRVTEIPHGEWRPIRFAGILKKMVAMILGCELSDLEKDSFKNTPLGEEWRRWYYTHYKFMSQHNPNGKITRFFPSEDEAIAYESKVIETIGNGFRLESELLTPRLVLQLLGTEGGRDVIHPNIWVNATLGNLKESEKIIVTDVRFPNEVTGIKQRKGIVIRVIRPSKISTSTHPSETSLNDFKDWDYVIVNDGTLEDLERNVREMLIHFNIIK